MTARTHFDFIIIGNGLAGLQLALKMASDAFFKDKQIALIDFSKKDTNDKTWSFWEKSVSQWDSIIYKTWKNANVLTSKKNIKLSLTPYQYKTIKAIDFYTHAKTCLQKYDNISFIVDEVITLDEESNNVNIKAKNQNYKASHVFDSRLPKTYHNTSKKNTKLIQHFKGIIIETKTPCFDVDCMTMMDYRLKDGKQTSFTYVLPFSKNKALIEFTYFTEHVVENQTYDKYINEYITTYLNISNYTISETEKGQIPMTDFPFKNYNSKHITKIGTGGGWVKGSTGYSFKHTEKKVAKIINNIKNNRLPSNKLFKKRYLFYDAIFLKVLKDNNVKGEWIFQQFYSRNNIATMFRFLDEESTFIDEIKIMVSLFSWDFIKAFFKVVTR